MVLAATSIQAQTTAYGLASVAGYNEASLVSFNPQVPQPLTSNRPITGVTSGQFLVGLDSRPATGELYALGYDAARQQAQLYRLDRNTAGATAAGPAQAVDLGADRSRIGFDFHPGQDVIRVTAGNSNSFVFNPDNGRLLITEPPVAYSATDPNAGRQPMVGASAYSNNLPKTTTTTLYHLDADSRRFATLVTQPNASTLRTVGDLNSYYVSSHSYTDLDIFTDPDSGINTAYLTISVPDYAYFATDFYTLDLTTGTLTRIGELTTGSAAVITNIALAIRPINLTTGTHKPTLVTGFNLFPNPVLDHAELSFHLPHAGAAELVLTDVLGNTVDRQNLGSIAAGTHQLTWHLLNKRPGIYILRLLLDGQSAGKQRIVVQ